MRARGMIVARVCPLGLPPACGCLVLVYAASALAGVQGRRDTRAAPRGRGAATSDGSCEADVERPGGDRGSRAAVAEGSSGLSARDAGHAVGVASAAGGGEVASASARSVPVLLRYSVEGVSERMHSLGHTLQGGCFGPQGWRRYRAAAGTNGVRFPTECAAEFVCIAAW